eukprot:8024708-Pyramimonas_sp.AAC.1
MTVIERLRKWFEWCPCHAPSHVHGDTLDIGKEDCPFRGCRGPELACGALENFVREVVGTCTIELESDLIDVQPQAYRDLCVSDFADGHRQFVFLLSVKMSFWLELPYVAIGMLHHDPAEAQKVAQSCLSQWENVKRLLSDVPGGANSVNVHPLIVHYLSEEGGLRPLVVLLAQGAQRDDPRLRPLMAELHKLQFVSCVSRSVE